MNTKLIVLVAVFLNINIFSIGQIYHTYKLSLDIYPSLWFKNKTWTLVRELDKCALDNKYYSFKKEDVQLISYFNKLDTILSNNEFYELGFTKVKGEIILHAVDGTKTYCKLHLPQKTESFGFHSGNIDSDSNLVELIDTFFNIAFYLFKKTDFNNNLTIGDHDTLEKLEPQIGSNSIRQVSLNPLLFRLFWRIEGDKENVYRYYDFFINLPKQRIVFIEVGKYFWITEKDDFYPLFKKFNRSRKKNIIWIASDKAKDYLINLGVNKKNIFSSLEEYGLRNKTGGNTGYTLPGF
jgi:hypothetical protein